MHKHQLFINGAWVDPSTGAWFESVNPFTAKPWALVPRGGKEDIDKAVAAAKGAFYSDAWRKLTATARGALLRKFADLATIEADRIAQVVATDNGKLYAEMKAQLNYIPQ